ncbi:hypothetical protein PC116_g5745 [Phytophthora cactorum]|uniref:Uncharacterized protein n=1 Tax=Phytophthora cactorum TaxID=29920 RepID=A0A8T1G205_9STRA|nr:hypothetical protein PC111_g13526 [Phytophthora cactorum]KAG2822384.1 hypothetical protein PC112_g10966 [Phytophthora cactorum]KAG2900464.1 hypothetical protein PC114_g13536 [Phytophthora cactorum]KAG2937656.1 hypothetical protein PC117_g11600 [Phytophthora cactorum]KAG2981248.1 hypothetical protein PC118_g10724 [Phytophthora cactorum]
MSGSGSSGMILVAVVAAETGTLGWTKVGAIAAAIAGRRIVSRNGEITRGAGRGSSTGWLSGSHGVTTTTTGGGFRLCEGMAVVELSASGS